MLSETSGSNIQATEHRVEENDLPALCGTAFQYFLSCCRCLGGGTGRGVSVVPSGGCVARLGCDVPPLRPVVNRQQHVLWSWESSYWTRLIFKTWEQRPEFHNRIGQKDFAVRIHTHTHTHTHTDIPGSHTESDLLSSGSLHCGVRGLCAVGAKPAFSGSGPERGGSSASCMAAPSGGCLLAQICCWADQALTDFESCTEAMRVAHS